MIRQPRSEYWVKMNYVELLNICSTISSTVVTFECSGISPMSIYSDNAQYFKQMSASNKCSNILIVAK